MLVSGTIVKSIFCTGTVYRPSKEQETTVKSVELPDAERQIERTSPAQKDDSVTGHFFRDVYGPFILHPTTKIVVIFVFIIYLTIAIWGCFRLKEGLTPEHIIIEDHYASQYYDKSKHFWVQGLQAHVVLERPPDLTNFNERMKLEELVKEFESTPHSMGREATVFW